MECKSLVVGKNNLEIICKGCQNPFSWGKKIRRRKASEYPASAKFATILVLMESTV